MLELLVEQNGLSATIASVVGCCYRLTPLKGKCTYPVFRGDFKGRPAAFVKVGTKAEWARTMNLLKAIGDCEFFSRFLADAPIEYKGSAVFVMEWRESRIVFPEDMTDRQAESLVAGCVKLSAALQRATDVIPIVASSLAPECLYGVVSDYARRHPLAGRLLNGILDVPATERVFGSRPLSVIHGDFHAKNFGFEGDAFAAVYDFDKLTYGLACSDLVNALVERFSCLGLSQSARRRLRDVTRRIVALAPWPREDLAVACNVARLQFAARRVRKHSASAWVALDVWRRDRKIREFLDCLEI